MASNAINISCPTTSLSRSQALKYFNMFNGLHCTNIFPANGNTSHLSLIQLGSKLSFSIKGHGRTRAELLSEEADLISHPNGTNVVGKNLSPGIETQPDAIAFGTLAAETIPTTGGFPVDNDEYDLDCPTEGFSSIPEAIQDIRQGKMVVVVDDEDRENEGDLIMAASKVTPEAMAFVVKHGTGIVCVSMKGEDLERLELPLMVTQKDNEEKLRTAVYSVSGCKTWYNYGGVSSRQGDNNIDSFLCEVVDDDGSMARLPKLQQFARMENLKVISIADLIRYRRKRDKLVELSSAARIPTMWGPFTAYCYRSILDGMEHIAMVKVSEVVTLIFQVIFAFHCKCNSKLMHTEGTVNISRVPILVFSLFFLSQVYLVLTLR
ncbi:hypothetical protein F0562_028907 [Nyssa sinensis]|uniref:3,4-dihydroxy-2-butanone-4-phosphate synthase n=1 Tax=Nyssa sinensis TaxID=561372 RepID=A0A5J5B157_9ASTE|nr:hypothetical protein F0562_028907 [Nyssa sinensis]